MRHFLHWGWREGRSPSSAFDAPFYLATKLPHGEAGVVPLARLEPAGPVAAGATASAPLRVAHLGAAGSS